MTRTSAVVSVLLLNNLLIAGIIGVGIYATYKTGNSSFMHVLWSLLLWVSPQTKSESESESKEQA